MRHCLAWLTAGVIIGATLPASGLDLCAKWGLLIRTITSDSVSHLLETLDLHRSEQWLPSLALMATTEPIRSHYAPSTEFLLTVATALEASPLSLPPILIDAILPLERLQQTKPGVAWVKAQLQTRRVPLVLGQRGFDPRVYISSVQESHHHSTQGPIPRLGGGEESLAHPNNSIRLDEEDASDEPSSSEPQADYPGSDTSSRSPRSISRPRTSGTPWPTNVLSYLLEEPQRSRIQSVNWCKQLRASDIFGEPHLNLWQLLDLPCLLRLGPTERRAILNGYTDIVRSSLAAELSDWFLFRAFLAESILHPRIHSRRSPWRHNTLATMLGGLEGEGLSDRAQSIVEFFSLLNSPYCQSLVNTHLPKLASIKDQVPPTLRSSFDFELLALIASVSPLLLDQQGVYLATVQGHFLELLARYPPNNVPPYIMRMALGRLLPYEGFLSIVKRGLLPPPWMQVYLRQSTRKGHFPALFLAGSAMIQLWRSHRVGLMEERTRARILNGLTIPKNGPRRPLVYSNELDSLDRCTADVHIIRSAELLLTAPGDLVRISADRNLRFLCDGLSTSEGEIISFFGGRLMALALNGTPLPPLAEELLHYLFKDGTKSLTQATNDMGANGRISGSSSRRRLNPKIIAATCFNSVKKTNRRGVSRLLGALAGLLRIWGVPRCLFPGEEYNY